MYNVNVGGITFIFTTEKTRPIYALCVFATNLIIKFLIGGEKIEI